MKVLTSQGGFTLIEMVTILTIIGILSGLLIVSTQVGNRRTQLRDAAAGYVSAARNAESLANSAQAVGPAGSQTARKAYGVCITSSQIPNAKCDDPVSVGKPADTYQVFARDPAETAPDTQAALLNRPGSTVSGVSNPPFIVSSYKLPQDFTFSNPGVWLDYVPPSGNLFKNGGTNNATLKIRYKGSCANAKDCQTIQIRPPAGAVYVQ